MDIDAKKVFLQQGSELYNKMIALAPGNTIRRYLAFRIIVNAMSFEDLVSNRQHNRMREIRNVLLAHKQEPEFYEGYRATDEIRAVTIQPLLDMMTTATGVVDPAHALPEITEPATAATFGRIVALILQKYQDDELEGIRLTNNFLSFEGGHIHEISKNDLAGCFYRYNSSKALMILANFLISNLIQAPELGGALRHAKLDLILHGMNMADCVFKDTYNSHSIDGLREIMTNQNIGDPTALNLLENEPRYQALYKAIRRSRNKLIGHMDKKEPLANLLQELDLLSFDDIFEFINKVDFAAYTAASTDIAAKVRYTSTGVKLNDKNIVSTNGLKANSYY